MEDRDPHAALCRLDDIPDGGAIAAHVPSATGGFALILARVGERVFGYYNECPHAARPLDWSPGKFLIEGGQIICAAHGASFFIESGKCFGGPCRGVGLTPVPVRVEDGAIRLR